MKNTFGTSVAVTLFGESHGPYIGAVIDGFTPGIEVDEDFIAHQLSLRRPSGAISTARVEEDKFQIVSGVYKGKTTGTPICILIPNSVQNSKDYDNIARVARPGHADYTAFVKYHGYEDYRGGGHFSGRITAPIVAAGAIAIDALKSKGINIGTHIQSLAGIHDRDFCNIEEDIDKLNDSDFAVLSDEIKEKMVRAIEDAAQSGDSVGGVLETYITGVTAGVGEPWYDNMESVLSHGLFAIPAVKGVQFGAGFDMVNSLGSRYNDCFRVTGSGDTVITETNNNGGINGGITNGMPISIRCAIKPTPSIYKEQKSVDFVNMKNEQLQIKGRHDPAIIHRARVVVDSMCALILCDMLCQRFGTDYFLK